MINILDTNIILRFIVGDNEEQKIKARKIFLDAEKGKINLQIKTVVIAEACYVLESFYKKEREEIANSMEVFLSQKWLKVEDRLPLTSMWRWYREKLHFVDSFLVASSKFNKYRILSFDKKLTKKIEANS